MDPKNWTALSPIFVLTAVQMLSLKRCLTFTPFLTIALGLAIHAARPEDRRLIRVLTISGILILLGTMGQMVRTDAWLTPRWTDPYRTIVSEMRQRGELDSETLVLTNASAIPYLRSDNSGLAAQQTHRSIPRKFHAIPLVNLDLVLEAMRGGSLPGGPYNRISIVFGGFTIDDPRSLQTVGLQLKELGFEIKEERSYAKDPNAEMKSKILRRQVPRHRILVQTYRKES
jgi:hypothetical protein